MHDIKLEQLKILKLYIFFTTATQYFMGFGRKGLYILSKTVELLGCFIPLGACPYRKN